MSSSHDSVTRHRFFRETDSKRIAGIILYTPKRATGSHQKIRLYHVFFIVLYMIQSVWLISSIGTPYRQFLEKADKEGIHVMQGSHKLRSQLERSLGDINDPNRRTKKIGYFDWMDFDIEELAAEKKRDRERTILDSLPKHLRVPNKYAPDFWPSLLFGLWATLHALVALLQYWNITFNLKINYQAVDPDKLKEAVLEHLDNEKLFDPTSLEPVPLDKLPPHWPTIARIVPSNTEDRHVLVPIEYFPSLGLTCEYHRRRYVYDSSYSTPIWTKIRCRTDFSGKFLHEWSGFQDANRLWQGMVRYGQNVFRVKEPTFLELYKVQILNPFSVFQVFCVLLWAIDDYLVYSFFSLFMVLMFEGTVVFQRLKSMQALRGMGNPSRDVYVFRQKQWISVDTTQLLPGDVLSLTRVQPQVQQEGAKRIINNDGGDIVPADVLLLRGSTVVNEASLTGESVPQMKEGISDLGTNEALSMKVKHKMNVAYAGTKMLQCMGDNESSASAGKYSQIPPPPDGGCVCLVLRTGFASAQGKLVRMIEGSQEKVKGHEKETGLLLLLLCVFAILSSSYVLYHGAKDENRSKYELLLHCILIVTSVIRPELPMQMALAVNNSLMTLMKLHIFCTEPYRVPIAGKLDACLFDKTGTLTTDELVAAGVCEPSKLKVPSGSEEDDNQHFLTPMREINHEAGLVLAGCHSLVVYDEETTGDPLEKAALRAMNWKISASSGHAVPAPATEKKPAGKNMVVEGGNISEVQILIRHHFSSKLQRMSCVVKCNGKAYAVAKGSPEAIGKLLSNKAEKYDEKAEYLSKQGYRVIALAYKRLNNDVDVDRAKDSRAVCEESLIFAGFVAFTCMVRKDTAVVLAKLKEGGMSIAMITGDALLTAIHVAKEVQIIEMLSGPKITEENTKKDEENEEILALLERKSKQNGKRKNKPNTFHKEYKKVAYLENDGKELFWVSYDNGSKISGFVASEVPTLSEEYDLAVSGNSLAAALEQDNNTTTVLAYIKVFARMTPDAKETVIECLHSVGKLCLMCGDGANDVGALKQADVGVALLSGFGNVNVDVAGKVEDKKEKQDDALRAIISQDYLDEIRAMPVSMIKLKLRSIGVDLSKYSQLVEKEDLVQLYQIKAREVAVKRHDEKNAKEKALMTKAEQQLERKREMADKQRRMMERVAELEAQGVQWAQFKAMREFWAAEMEDAKQKKGAIAKNRGVEGSAATLAAQFEDMDMGDIPMIKLGDASIAAPFTSKMPSIRSCVDIVRQGRCTLVSTIQMYQIMALQCLISSYSLSVLYLDGVKYGDSQMTAMGILGTVSFMSVSRSKPLDKLSKVRPLNSIFHPALFASLLGQFAIHFSTMLLAVHTAKQHLPPDFKIELDGEFKPGILNTVVFLVSSVQQVTVFACNLQGRPFMTGVTENTPLLWSLIGTFILTFMFASETVPGLNRYFQLVPFPNESYRDFIIILLVLDLVACFLFDRLMQFFFCRHILKASVEGTSVKDVFKLARSFAIVGFLMYSMFGNSEVFDTLLAMENATLEDINSTIDVTNKVIESVDAHVEL